MLQKEKDAAEFPRPSLLYRSNMRFPSARAQNGPSWMWQFDTEGAETVYEAHIFFRSATRMGVGVALLFVAGRLWG